MIHQKHKKSLEEITNDLCPVLSVQQLYRISTMYWDDRYNTETVSHEARPDLLCLYRTVYKTRFIPNTYKGSEPP